jgi:hypothetical protein
LAEDCLSGEWLRNQIRAVNSYPYAYSYSVFWSDENEGYVCTVEEFPSLSHISDDTLHPMEALGQMVSLVKEILEDMLHTGETIPMPKGDN